MLVNGQKVKDQISGQQGVVGNAKRYPNGTVHYLVKLGAGKEARDLWFAESQLDIVGKRLEPKK